MRRAASRDSRFGARAKRHLLELGFPSWGTTGVPWTPGFGQEEADTARTKTVRGACGEFGGKDLRRSGQARSAHQAWQVYRITRSDPPILRGVPELPRGVTPEHATDGRLVSVKAGRCGTPGPRPRPKNSVNPQSPRRAPPPGPGHPQRHPTPGRLLPAPARRSRSRLPLPRSRRRTLRRSRPR